MGLGDSGESNAPVGCDGAIGKSDGGSGSGDTVCAHCGSADKVGATILGAAEGKVLGTAAMKRSLNANISVGRASSTLEVHNGCASCPFCSGVDCQAEEGLEVAHSKGEVLTAWALGCPLLSGDVVVRKGDRI